MDVVTHIGYLVGEGALLAGAAERAGLDAPVPTCPGWSVRDLVRHTGGVHRWAATVMTAPRTELWYPDLEELVGGWPPDAGLVDWFRAGHARLVTVLRDADPALECFTFLAAPSPRAMWARRQAHETAVHRVDAQLAGGTVTPVDTPFAADGVDEFLSGFVTRGSRRLHLDPPRVLRVRATDTGDVWDVGFGTGPAATVRNPPPQHVDATLEGTAAELYLAVWSRLDARGLRTSGDPAVLAHFVDNAHVRW